MDEEKLYGNNFQDRLYGNEIKLMKERFENFDSSSVIGKIIQSAKIQIQSQKKQFQTRDDYLDNIKTQSKNSFMDNIKNKKLNEIISSFEKNIEENINACKLFVDKKEKEKFDKYY